MNDKFKSERPDMIKSHVFLHISILFSSLFITAASGQDFITHSRLTHHWEFFKGDLGGVWEALRSDSLSGNLPEWKTINIPHCFNAYDSVDPDMPYYQGPAWYRTQLTINNPHPNGRTLLHFEGAGQKTDVYINAEKVGSHSGGYDEFTIDITDAVNRYKRLPDFISGSRDRISKKGTIPLVIRCDNSRDLELIPSDLSDFNLYGGLYRYVNLVYVPAISLDRIHLQTERQSDGTWRILSQGRLYNPQLSKDVVSLDIQILQPNGQAIYHGQRILNPWDNMAPLFEYAIQNPILWSPDSPELYQCIVSLETKAGKSSIQESFGLRWFEFKENGPFFLNSKQLLLRGTHRHEDFAGLAAAIPEELIVKEMQMIKDMGVNFIRLGHYQQSRIVLELCDKLGILVWEEIPWCRGGLGGERYQQQARDMLWAMIDQHFNHPSVMIWGLGNENDWPGDFEQFNKDEIRAFMQELNDLSHQLDPSRKTAIRRCDFCCDIVDVYSPSIWAGWYRGKFTEYKPVSEAAMKKVKHFLHVEWGGDSHARRHSENPYTVLRDIQTTGQADERGLDYMMTGGSARASKDGDWSESYICDLIDWHLKEQETMDWLTGTAYWIFKDFSTPLRPDNPVPYMNQKGVVERDLTPKEAYYVFQSYWTQKPMVRIYSHSWPVRWGKDKENKTVKIYSNCSEAELFVNGKSAGKKQRNSLDFPAAGLRWSVPFKKGMNNLKAVAWKDGVEVSDEITFRYETRTWDQPAKFVLKEFQRRGDSVTIQGLLMDNKGILCLDARDFVQFGLTGNGTLLDNLGTSRGARKVQLYNGQAMIDVQLNGGASTVSLSYNGFPTVFLNIESFSNKTDLKEASRRERALYVAQLDRERIIKLATSCLDIKPISLRDFPAPPTSKAGPGDYYSMGDYWWPNPDTANGLPYVQRDGQSNPDNFSQHRMMLRTFRDAVSALAAAYALDKNEEYANKAVELLNVFFVDADKRMHPHLLYAQAIPGVTDGRGIGIIDTLHLTEIPLAIEVLKTSNAMTPEILSSLKKWFADYAEWMITHPNGIQEMNAANNHSVAYLVQLAAFAKLTQDTKILSMIRTRYKDIILPSQMDLDGSFPAELARTKPYGYSIFQLDNMVLLCHLLSITVAKAI